MYTCSSHVRSPSGLDLLNVLKRLLLQQLVKVCNDLVQQPQTLHSLIVGLKLHVEVREVRNGGKQDAHALTLLVVQLLRVLGGC